MTYSSSRNNHNNRNSDRGLPLTIHNVSAYIKANADFINQTHVNAFDDFDHNTRDVERQIGPQGGRPGNSIDLSNLPQNLDHIFGTYDLKRATVISEVGCPGDKDVSFVSALLTGAIENYDDYKTKIKIDLTEKMIRKCLKEYQLAFKNFRYESYGWKPKDLRRTISMFTMNRELLRYFVDMLYVNLFILDVDEDRLSYVGSDTYIKHKKNIFLLKFGDEHFEIVYKQESKSRQYVFDYKSGIVRKLINSSFCVEKMDCNYNNSEEDVEFVIGDETFETMDDVSNESTASLNSDISEHYDDEFSESLDGIKFEEGDAKESEYPIVGITEAAEFSESEEYDSDEESDDGSESLDNESNDQDEYEEEDDEEEEESDNVRADDSMTKSKLVALAKELEVDIYYRNKSGKRVGKTKPMLIKDVNEA
jgi:hypothetical protein